MAFHIEGSKFENVTSERSILLFRAIMYAEAWRVNIPKANIAISEKLNTTDGGIDGTIDNSSNQPSQFIRNGLNSYQIKAYNAGPAECVKEMHVADKPNGPLKPSLIQVLQAGGSYTVVMFAKLTDIMERDRLAEIKADLAKHGFNNHVEIWDSSKLAAYSSQFPSVISLIEPRFMSMLPHAIWSETGQMKEPIKYYADDARAANSESIQKKIIATNEVMFFRVDGLPGIGKTRFVCETLRDSDFANSVIYVLADKFFANGTIESILKDDSISGIFVIDECSLEQHAQIVNFFQKQARKLVFITMSYQIGKPSGNTDRISLEGLPDEVIAEILSDNFKSIPPEVLHKLKEFASGFPRIATLLGESFVRNPGGTSKIEDDVLMDRLISGKHPLGNDGIKEREILSLVAIFDKVGYSEEVEYEAKWLCEIHKIDFKEFRRVVERQRERGIIQGDNFIYVSPQILKVYLLNIWWVENGITFNDFTKFIESMPSQSKADLFERFSRHIPNLDTSEKGKDFVRRVLDPNSGLFSEPESIKSRLPADFFFRLAEVDAGAALTVLEKHFSTFTVEMLSKFTEGRREIIRTLEVIAAWDNYFVRAAQLLLRLSLGENESYSNNSTGILTDLFSLGAFEVANTSALPENRLNFIKTLLDSKEIDVYKIGVSCLGSYLAVSARGRVIGVEYQGSRVLKLYKPKTYGELFEAWAEGWKLLSQLIEKKPSDQLREIVLKNGRAAIGIAALTNLVIQCYKNLPQNNAENSKKIFLNIQNILRYEGSKLSDDAKQELRAIQELPSKGDEIFSNLRRYVGTHFYDDPSIIDRKNAEKLRQEKVKLLAQTCGRNIEQFEKYLEWLFSLDAENAWSFGNELGQLENKLQILNLLSGYLKSNSKSVKNVTMLGGMLAQLRLENAELVEKQLEEYATYAVEHLLEIIYRSGATDNTIDLIIKADSTIMQFPTNQFAFLSYGGALTNVSPLKVELLLNYILQKPDQQVASIALQMFEFYFSGEREKYTTVDLGVKILTDMRLLSPDSYKTNSMTDYYWNELANQIVRLDQNKLLPLASVLVLNFGSEGGVADGYDPLVASFMNKAVAKHPEEIWKLASKILENFSHKSSWSIRHWLQKSIHYFPKKLILDWISESIEGRAGLIASMVPKDFAQGSNSITRALLENYGEIDAVRSALSANSHSGVFWGSRSKHYEEEAEFYTDLAKIETVAKIKTWFESMASYAHKRALEARIDEEREGDR